MDDNSSRVGIEYVDYLRAAAALGLTPGVTLSLTLVRKTHIATLRTCDPDRFQDDADRLAQTQRVNAARDTLVDISKAGLLGEYNLRADYEIRTGLEHRKPSDRSAVLLMVAIVLAPAGTGKTQGWVRSMHRGARRPGLIRRTAICTSSRHRPRSRSSSRRRRICWRAASARRSP